MFDYCMCVACDYTHQMFHNSIVENTICGHCLYFQIEVKTGACKNYGLTGSGLRQETINKNNSVIRYVDSSNNVWYFKVSIKRQKTFIFSAWEGSAVYIFELTRKKYLNFIDYKMLQKLRWLYQHNTWRNGNIML